MNTLPSKMPSGLEDASSPPRIKHGNASPAAAGSKAVVHPSFPGDVNPVPVSIAAPDNNGQLTYNTGYVSGVSIVSRFGPTLVTLVAMSQATMLLSSSSIILQGTEAGSGYLDFVHIV
ncbi:hypothetical protein IFR04_000416 [Cadophora malorum]|uniref:Uncharacterized protein n=1 Tax=Cadophora malorum TaxID=108018 RepID=A0A8H8BWR6_9HELO|nr:hypothetical protein IFR04_000416 [Cadophora malorum]